MFCMALFCCVLQFLAVVYRCVNLFFFYEALPDTCRLLCYCP